MQCVEREGQKVLSMLYKVKPYEVRELKGAFGEAFKSNMHLFEEDVKQQGPEALRNVVGSRIFESEKFANGYVVFLLLIDPRRKKNFRIYHPQFLFCGAINKFSRVVLFDKREGKLIKELVQVIMDEQLHDFLLPLPGNLVGDDDRVVEVMKMVDTDPSETQIIGICGIGGIGKTTLAKNIYNKLAKKFECRSFLMDIRETINRNGVEHVQNLLISDITGNQGTHVPDSMRGIANIQSSCDKKKVLILLDDVGHRDHLNKLIKGCNYKLGSRIIITCRDKALLKSEYECFELEEMNDKDSMLLFRLCAFGAEQPPTELVTLSRNIVLTIGGLPLALEIIGSFLKGKDQSIWTETLEKLKKAPHIDVQQKLRISYDSLEYEQQQMFLDIACFFIGIKKRFIAYLWEDLQYSPDSGLKRMIELSLIKVDGNDELRMHDQLRDLGRVIACPANKKPWKCSRLWDEKATIVQRSKEENRYIEALRPDENGSNMFMNPKSFKRMPYLKFLHLKVDCVGNFEDSLSELRWLKWEKCSNSFGVTNLHLEKLLILDLSYGYIRHEWGRWSSIKMERLKVLNLSHCIELVRTPNLSAFKSLEILILEYCDNLEEIGPSIGNAKCLTSLNLSNCRRLKKLPSQLGELKRLVSLNLSSCCILEELPKEMGKLEELKELTIDDVQIKEIPPSIKSLTKLEILSALNCRSLVGLPDSISHLVNLSTLDLRWCKKLKKLPESIGSLVKLQRLVLGNMALSFEVDDGEYHWNHRDICWFSHIPCSIGKLKLLIELHLTCTKIWELPESIGDLKNLKVLKIAGCKELESLPSTISKLGKLEELDATACMSLKWELSVNRLSSLKILQLGKLCHTIDLFELHEMDCLPSSKFLRALYFRRHLDLINCDLPISLTVLKVTCWNYELPQLSHLIHLKELSFQCCTLLKSIPVLPSGILNLCIIYCGRLKKLPSLSSLESLSELHIIRCGELMEIEGLGGLKSLGILFLCKCKKLLNLNGLEHLESLRRLEIEDLDASLMNDHQFLVECLGRLKNLERLCIARCQSLTRLDISQLTHMTELLVFECKKVDEIKGLEGLKKLTYLNIKGCKSIRKLPDFSLFDDLSQLDIEGCWKLQEVQLQGLKSDVTVFR